MSPYGRRLARIFCIDLETHFIITQPVLPVLQHESSADMVVVSLTVSAVLLGIARS